MKLYSAIICRESDIEEVVGIFSSVEKATEVLESEEFLNYTAFVKEYVLDTVGETDFECIVRIVECEE